jgi:GLPGLI family protein
MKNLNAILTILFSCISFLTSAQTSGIISYTEVSKLSISTENLPEGIDLTGMFPSSSTVNKELYFDGKKSLYKDGENDVADMEMSSDDGSFHIVMMESNTEALLYLDRAKNEIIDQQDFMGKAFVVSYEMPKYKWKITNEKVKYLDYECMKATTTNDEGEVVVAWFAPSLRSGSGPATYGQLPGAILMLSVNDGQVEIKATKVDLKNIKEIKKPKDGKKVSLEEYDKIKEEKMKEMEDEYGAGAVIEFKG